MKYLIYFHDCLLMAMINTSLSLPLNTLGQHSLCGRHEIRLWQIWSGCFVLLVLSSSSFGVTSLNTVAAVLCGYHTPAAILIVLQQKKTIESQRDGWTKCSCKWAGALMPFFFSEIRNKSAFPYRLKNFMRKSSCFDELLYTSGLVKALISDRMFGRCGPSEVD